MKSFVISKEEVKKSIAVLKNVGIEIVVMEKHRHGFGYQGNELLNTQLTGARSILARSSYTPADTICTQEIWLEDLAFLTPALSSNYSEVVNAAFVVIITSLTDKPYFSFIYTTFIFDRNMTYLTNFLNLYGVTISRFRRHKTQIRRTQNEDFEITIS